MFVRRTTHVAWGTNLRGLSFGVGRSSGLSAPDADRQTGPYAPAAAGNRVRRRLADVVEGAFNDALMQGDLLTAEDLLGVLENMQARAKVSARNDRRGDAQRRLERARKELEARKHNRYRRF